MTHHLTLYVLLMLSFNVHSEWQRIAAPATGIEVYFDLSRIEKNAKNKDRATAWVVYNYDTPNIEKEGKLYHSMLSQKGYDCKNKKARFQSHASYPEKFAKGDLILKTEISPKYYKWDHVIPGTFIETELQLACKNIIKLSQVQK